MNESTFEGRREPPRLYNSGGNEKRARRPFFDNLQTLSKSVDLYVERETRLELATPTLARSCSTN